MKMKRFIAALTVVVLMSGVTGCGGGASSTSFSGTHEADTVTLNITAEPMDLNPMRICDGISQSVLAHCMSGFTRLDPQDAPVADLAESWEINEDNTIYTMKLRKDATWSNGEPVTMNDFYYSWVTQMTPETGSVFASYLYNNIKNGEAFYNGEVDASALGLKVVDDTTMTIEWSHPMPEANGLFYLAQPFYLPINQKAYESIGDQQYAKDGDMMLTNGAYIISEWIHDDHITMEKSESYYDAAAINVPVVKLAMIGDSNASLNAFMTGEVDLTNLYNEQIAQVKEKDENAIQSYVDGGSWYLNFNTKDENLSNINLRKALAYAIDTQSLLDNVINDGSVAANGLVPDVVAGVGGTSYAQARGSLFAMDQAAAVGYLEQALQELGKTKEELNLEFWGSDTAYNQNQAAYLQQQWKEHLGLDVQIKAMPVKALQEAQYGGEYSFLVDGWGPTENDAITFLENYETGNLNNSGMYSNEAYDNLIAQSKEEKDAVKRQDLLIEAEKILIGDMAVGPMYFTCSTYAVSDKLVGVVRTPFQQFNLRGASIAAE